MDTTNRKIQMRMSHRMKAAMGENNIEVYLCSNKEQALEKALELIPKQTTVSCGKSRTLEEMGLPEKLKNGDYQYVERKGNVQEQCESLVQTVLSKAYVTSVHAVSEDGTLVLVERTGARIAAVAFGADDVIMIVGINKLCRTEKAAEEHAREQSGSNYVLKIHGCLIPGRIKVILVTEHLGE